MFGGHKMVFILAGSEGLVWMKQGLDSPARYETGTSDAQPS